jgi:LysM repeat protein/predicted nucleic acid-binding Zn ribbon protein
MVQDQIAPDEQNNPERRCPNCGTRVAQDAETCFRCGNDLRVKPRPTRQISWIDAVLVLAVLAVLLFWWQIGGQPSSEEARDPAISDILPTSVPLLASAPTPTITPEPGPTATPIVPEEVFLTHDVSSGETLLSISGIYGVTVEDIQRANNLDDVLIRIDDKLIIPVLREGLAESDIPISSQFTYKVKVGDTIVTIATLFGSTIQDILEANGMSATDIIRPDDELTVPVRGVPDEVIEGEVTPDSDTIDSAAMFADDDGSIYIEPRLTGPANRATISRDEPALLRWVSVDLLAPNEWYVVLIYPTEGDAQVLPTVWTKGTSYRLGTEFAPEEGQSAGYTWLVSVARVNPMPDGRRELEAASPPSLSRTFTWE